MTKRTVRQAGRRVAGRNPNTNAAALPSYTVATAPSAAGRAGDLIYVSNGAAGTAVAAWSDGTNWKRADTGATISAS